MTDFKKITLCRQIQKFKACFYELSHMPFNALFPSDLITKIIARSRDKVFTPLVTLKTFIFQVLSEDGSCKASRCQLIDRTAPAGAITELCQYRPLLQGPPTLGLSPPA